MVSRLAGAIERIAAFADLGVRGAKVIFVGAELAIKEADLNEAVAGRRSHLRIPVGRGNGEDVNAGLACRRRFLRLVDVEHGQLALAL